MSIRGIEHENGIVYARRGVGGLAREEHAGGWGISERGALTLMQRKMKIFLELLSDKTWRRTRFVSARKPPSPKAEAEEEENADRARAEEAGLLPLAALASSPRHAASAFLAKF